MFGLVVWILTGVLVGGFIGWVTNVLVFQMLFGKFRIWRWQVFRCKGLLEKKRPELADKIGSVVSDQLLTPETLIEEFDNDTIKHRLQDEIRLLIGKFVKKDLGTLSQVAGRKYLPALKEAEAKILRELSPVIEKAVLSSECTNWILSQLIKTSRYYAETPIVYVLGTEKIDSFLDRGIRFVSENLGRKDNYLFEQLNDYILTEIRGNQDYLDNRLKVLMRKEGMKLSGSLIDDVIDRFSDWLGSPDNQQKIKANILPVIRSIAGKLADDHKLLALFIDIEKRVRLIVNDNFSEVIEHLRDRLSDRSLRNDLDQAFKDYFPMAVEKFELEAILNSDSFENLAADFSEGLKMQLPKLANNEAVFNQIKVELYKFLERPFSAFIPDWRSQVKGLFSDALDNFKKNLKSQQPSVVYLILESMADDFIENTKIGRLDKKIGDGNIKIFAEHMASLVHPQLLESVPEILNSIEIDSIVKNQINNYSGDELEETIKAVSKNELEIIIRLGGAFGAVTGGVCQLGLYYFQGVIF